MYSSEVVSLFATHLCLPVPGAYAGFFKGGLHTCSRGSGGTPPRKILNFRTPEIESGAI